MTAPNRRPSIEHTLEDHVARIRRLEANPIPTPGNSAHWSGGGFSLPFDGATPHEVVFTMNWDFIGGITTADNKLYDVPSIGGDKAIYSLHIYVSVLSNFDQDNEQYELWLDSSQGGAGTGLSQYVLVHHDESEFPLLGIDRMGFIYAFGGSCSFYLTLYGYGLSTIDIYAVDVDLVYLGQYE